MPSESSTRAASLGAIAAPPLVAAIILTFGWRALFLAAGLAGLVWLAFWWKLYRVPSYSLEHIPAAPPSNSWRHLFRSRKTWALLLAKFLSDAAWYFFLFWLPRYLSESRHLGIVTDVSHALVPGANVISAASGRDVSSLQAFTKSGTNRYHGELFESFENSALDAWNAYTKLTTPPGTKKAVLQKSRYGGNFGGPIYVPKLYKGKDRLFFFLNYERLHQNSFGSLSTSRVPTAAERQGDFGAVLQRFGGSPNYQLWNPFSTVIDAKGNSTRTPVPNNDLRTIAPINTAAQQVLTLLPMPNGYFNPSNPNSLNNFATLTATLTTRYEWDMRFDYRLTDNDAVYVSHNRYNNGAASVGGIIPQLSGTAQSWTNLLNANYAHVFTPRLTNEFLFGWAYYQSDPAALSIANYLHNPSTPRTQNFQNIGNGDDQGYGRIYFGSGWPSIGPEEVYINSQLTYQTSENLHYVVGKHNLQFGANYLYENEHDWDFVRDVEFSNTMTRGGSLNTPSRLGGDGMATFLLGIPTYMLQTLSYPSNQEPRLDFSSEYFGLYVQDRWQVSPRLTLDLGLRYDLSIPAYSPSDYGNIKMDFNVPGWQEETPGRYAGLPEHWVPPSKHNFAPRVGIAYRIKSNLVARVNYGIFYDAGNTINGGSTYDYMMGATSGYTGSEYSNADAGINNDLPYYKFSDIFPAQQKSDLNTFPVSTGAGAGYFTTPRSVVAFYPQSGKLPYYQRYMAQVDKGLGPNNKISFSYVGGRGTDLRYYDNVNIPAYQTGWTSTNIYNAARPSTRFGDVRLISNGMNSFYNSGTVQFQRRMSKGLLLTANYTFSKTVMDYNADQAGGFGLPTADFGGYASVPESWDWHTKLSRGEAPFSLPNRLVSGFNYTLPWGVTLPKFAKAALWGWGLSGTTTFQSGQALTVFNGQTSAFDMEPDMPYLLSNPNLSKGQRTFQQFFNTAAFAAPPNNVKGDAGVGIVRGPGVNNWDLGASKTFQPKERLRVLFRAEFSNAFNHTQWSGVNTTYSNLPGNTFGWITGARDPRFLQFFLRASF